MKRFVAALGAMALLSSGAAWSGVIAYTTKSSFDANAGATSTETFNSFTTDTFFSQTPVVLQFFTLSATGSGNNGNKIDVPPYEFPQVSVDGTPAVFAFVGGNLFVTYTFAQPVLSFGAAFDDFGTSGATTVTAAGQTFTAPQTVPGQLSFYGLVSTTPFTTVTFGTSNGNDGFGMDNVEFGFAPSVATVPEPEEALLVASGFLAAAFSARRRKRVR